MAILARAVSALYLHSLISGDVSPAVGHGLAFPWPPQSHSPPARSVRPGRRKPGRRRRPLSGSDFDSVEVSHVLKTDSGR